jgi:hypothetical protein
MSKVALKLLPLAVAFCVLLEFHGGADHPAEAPETGYQPWKATLDTDGAPTHMKAVDDDSVQQAACEGQMQTLRNSFIEARHRAIEKNSCKTAAHASTFLMVFEECQKACPPDYLNQNGFTGRIVRNIQWLGSYNSKKCSSAPP